MRMQTAVAGSSLTALLTLRALLSKGGMGFPEGLSSPKQWTSEQGDSVLLAIQHLRAGEITKGEPLSSLKIEGAGLLVSLEISLLCGAFELRQSVSHQATPLG